MSEDVSPFLQCGKPDLITVEGQDIEDLAREKLVEAGRFFVGINATLAQLALRGKSGRSSPYSAARTSSAFWGCQAGAPSVALPSSVPSFDHDRRGMTRLLRRT